MTNNIPEPDRCDQCGIGLFDNRKAVWIPEMRVHLCKKCHAQYKKHKETKR